MDLQISRQKMNTVVHGWMHFELVYWADQHYPQPLVPDDEPYIPTPENKQIKKYRDNWLDEFRAHTVEIVGSVISAEEKWFGRNPISREVLEHKLTGGP
jgi:hypothetical protein